MSRRLSFLITLIAFQACALFAENQHIPLQKGQSFTEPQTGVLFGRKIDGLSLFDATIFESKNLGVSVRYHNADESEKVDIYIYNDDLETINDDNDQAQSKRQIKIAIDAIREFVKRGKYRNATIKDGLEIRTSKIEDDTLTLVTKRAKIERLRAEKFVPAETSISVATYQNHFLKIRHTIPDDLTAKEIEQRRATVIHGLTIFLREHQLRPAIDAALEDYAADPLSEKGQAAAGTLFAYADVSELISISISTSYIPWLKTPKKNYEEDHYDKLGEIFLSAFIAGHVEDQLQNNTPDPYPGILKQLEVYEKLKKRGDLKEPVPSYENWLKKKSDGTLKDHVATLE